MKDKTEDVFVTNGEILQLLHIVDEINWPKIREKTIQRVLYLSKVLYSFVYPEQQRKFEHLTFSRTISGPFSELVASSIVNLLSRELISEDDDGKVELLSREFDFDVDEIEREWLKTVIYILGLYGESVVFNFTLRDPVYQESLETNSAKDLDMSGENSTLKVLNSFRTAFEESLSDVSSIDGKEYLELYFEFVFSTIIKRENVG